MLAPNGPLVGVRQPTLEQGHDPMDPRQQALAFGLAAAIARLSIVESAKYMAPYLVILFIGLLVITYLPWFTLVLPQTFLR